MAMGNGQLLKTTQKSTSLSVVVTRGTLVSWCGRKELWVVSGWDKDANLVWIARDDQTMPVNPTEVGLEWAKSFAMSES